MPSESTRGLREIDTLPDDAIVKLSDSHAAGPTRNAIPGRTSRELVALRSIRVWQGHSAPDHRWPTDVPAERSPSGRVAAAGGGARRGRSCEAEGAPAGWGRRVGGPACSRRKTRRRGNASTGRSSRGRGLNRRSRCAPSSRPDERFRRMPSAKSSMRNSASSFWKPAGGCSSSRSLPAPPAFEQQVKAASSTGCARVRASRKPIREPDALQVLVGAVGHAVAVRGRRRRRRAAGGRHHEQHHPPASRAALALW